VNTLIRWGKFNLVGAMGMAVQLAALALFTRCWPGSYLLATAAAIELTLLHNFVWHLHFTWRDRRNGSALLVQCVRFHLSNGLVSMLGTLALMRVLVQGAHLPVLRKFDRDSLLLHCQLLPGRVLGVRGQCEGNADLEIVSGIQKMVSPGWEVFPAGAVVCSWRILSTKIRRNRQEDL
jgi:putative flippase GtrA